MERPSPRTNVTPRSRHGYFLECRKDAQCACSMCKASIHATLDLRPASSLFGAVTTNTVDSASPELSSPLKAVMTTGKENRSPAADTESACTTRTLAPHLSQLSRLSGVRKTREEGEFAIEVRRRGGAVYRRRGWQLLLLLAFSVEFVWPWIVSRLSEPSLSAGGVRQVAEAAMVREKLVDRLDFVDFNLSRAVHSASVYNCTGPRSRWRLAEDGHFVHSSCALYASPIESLSVWGYAARTGGVLGRSFVDRSFTVLSGRAVEWQEGQIQYIVHSEGSSWIMPQWAASAILLDGNTWILEYRRTVLSQGLGGLPGLLHLAKYGLRKVLGKVKIFLDTAFFAPVQAFQFQGSTPPPT